MLHQFTQKRLNRWLLVLLSGLLLIVAFPFTGSIFPVAFVAWIPLLLTEQAYTGGRRSLPLFFQAYVSFLIFNIGTTWWIYFADPGGAYMAFICNSLVMALAFYVYHRFKRKLGGKWSLAVFLCVWISFEYMHLNWELSWPWLTLGNTFARVPEIVQWYSWTGILGGSAWIICGNFLLLRLLTSSNFSLKQKTVRLSIVFAAPVILSLCMYAGYTETRQPYEIVVLQPNIDPYSEKFNGSDGEQLEKMLKLADQEITPGTQLVMAPETALFPRSQVEEEELRQVGVRRLKERIGRWKSSSLLIGATTLKFFEVKHSRASKKDTEGPGFYEFYNSSLLFTQDRAPSVIHKSKLVLGVEKIPFSNIFPWLEDLSINLGGSSGTLGIEDNGPSVMKAGKTTFAPVVCYESIYGDFVRSQCKQGAGFIAVITNDGWWQDTPGYRQHFAFSRLRAVENRKYVARSANTGKSGFINQRGDVVKESGWWYEAALRETIQLNTRKTMYQLMGDWIGYAAVAGFFAFMIMCLARAFRKKGTEAKIS